MKFLPELVRTTWFENTYVDDAVKKERETKMSLKQSEETARILQKAKTVQLRNGK